MWSAVEPVPVIAIGNVPVGVFCARSSVSVEDPPAPTEAGSNVAVTPAGRPVALSVTVWAEPLVTVVVTDDEPLEPCFAVTAGPAAIEKSSTVAAAQPGSEKEPIRVRQLKVPFAGRYSLVYQKVQSSTGSMLIEE